MTNSFTSIKKCDVFIRAKLVQFVKVAIRSCFIKLSKQVDQLADNDIIWSLMFQWILKDNISIFDFIRMFEQPIIKPVACFLFSVS